MAMTNSATLQFNQGSIQLEFNAQAWAFPFGVNWTPGSCYLHFLCFHLMVRPGFRWNQENPRLHKRFYSGAA